MRIGLLSLALTACGSGSPFDDVRVDLDTGEGPAGSAARHPHVCASGALVYAVWADDRGGSPQIRFRQSRDGGLTWAPDEVVLSGGPDGAVADVPSLACDGEWVAVAWQDDRHSDLGDPTVYARTSDDGGDSWMPERRLTADARGDWRALEPTIAVDGGWVYAVWHDNRYGAFDLFFNVSDDGGDSWLDHEVRLDTDAEGAAYSAHAVLALDGLGGVYVAWEDSRSVLNDIRFNRSWDHGNPGTWLATDLRLDTGDDPGATSSYAPSIAAGYGTVAVAWHERHPDGAQVLVQASRTDSLAFFAEPARVDAGVAQSLFPSVAMLGDDRVGVVWRDDERGTFDVLYAGSDDGGSTWSEAVQVDASSNDDSDTPVLAARGDTLAVAWADLRHSPPEAPREDIYVAASEDGGRSWHPEWRVNDYPPGEVRAVFPSIGLDAERGQVHVLWEDWRDGNPDVYFRATTLRGEAPEGW